MMSYTRPFGLLIALGFAVLAPAARAADDTTRVLVPVVGTVRGVGDVQWRTEFSMVNDLQQSVDVILTLPTVGDEYLLGLTLQPGQAIHFPDLMGETFGLNGVLAPLLVATSGRRPLPIQTVVWGAKGTDSPHAQVIPVLYSTAAFPLQILSGLSFNQQFRTNIGLGNMASTAAEFVLALRRVEGRNVSVRSLVMPPNTLWQIPIQVLFPIITDGDNFSLAIQAPAADTYVYASVVGNDSAEARFVQPGVGPIPAPEFTAQAREFDAP
jgi:hypothetical protein